MRFKNYDDNYREITLKDVCTLITKGTTPAKFSTNGINFIKIDSLNGNYVDNSKVTHINESIHNTLLSRSILEENDILLAIAGATVGKHCIIQKSNLPANTNQALAIIRLNKHLLPYYLLAFFDTNYLPSYIKLICAASAQPNLNLQQVGQIKLNIPTIQEQEKVCHFIQLLDKRISVQNKIISKYETLIKGLCDILFTKTEENALPLKAITSIDKGQQINGLSLAKTGKYYYLNGGITPSGYVDAYNTLENTIAISEGGNSCGFVSYNTQKFWSGGHCYTLKIKGTQCRSKFLFFYLKYREKDIMQLRVGSGLPNIQKKSLENFVVPLPTFEKQCYIERVLESITAKKEIETALLGQFQSQKKFLLSKMFI